MDISHLKNAELEQKYGADSTKCYCYLRHIHKGPDMLFGAVVECHPISLKDLSRLHQFRKTVLPGLFLGYALVAR